jgi:hypothetical protein
LWPQSSTPQTSERNLVAVAAMGRYRNCGRRYFVLWSNHGDDMAVRFAGEADQDFLGLAKRVADGNFEVETRRNAEIFTVYYYYV